ncbi:MAG: DUF429 domain-containing protein [Pseudomonadota bacterium]
MGEPWVAGADGCPAGWLVVRVPGGRPAEARATITGTAAEASALGTPLAIDIPIGLMDTPQDGPRPVDRAARAFLAKRAPDDVRAPGSRVFPAPSRAHLDFFRKTRDYGALRTAFPPPNAISVQCFNICGKIAEVDDLLRASPDATVWEAHPEIAFAALTGRTLPPKKRPEGRQARESALTALGFDANALAARLGPRTGRWGWDDLLDACVCAHVAGRIAAGRNGTLPDAPDRDSLGLWRAIRF